MPLPPTEGVAGFSPWLLPISPLDDPRLGSADGRTIYGSDTLLDKVVGVETEDVKTVVDELDVLLGASEGEILGVVAADALIVSVIVI